MRLEEASDADEEFKDSKGSFAAKFSRKMAVMHGMRKQIISLFVYLVGMLMSR